MLKFSFIFFRFYIYFRDSEYLNQCIPVIFIEWDINNSFLFHVILIHDSDFGF